MSFPTVDLASIESPRDGLRAVVALRTLADRLEAREVGRALADGWTYQEIADVLGVSRQAVHKKQSKRR